MKKNEEILNECLEKYGQSLDGSPAQRQCVYDAMEAAMNEEGRSFFLASGAIVYTWDVLGYNFSSNNSLILKPHTREQH